jgi:hypothetical protein
MLGGQLLGKLIATLVPIELVLRRVNSRSLLEDLPRDRS